jgi:FAD/FMN-containing dehydrogenase
MHDAVEYLRNKLRNEVDILQEYFIPMRNFVPFIDDLRNILKHSGIVTLNVSVRIVHPEDMLLSYAHQTMFAIVLYLNQQASPAGIEQMKTLTQKLIELSFKHGGTFFLPYQLYYTKDQLIKGYPNIEKFFELKRKYDPTHLFTNLFYQKYALADFKG